jgi:hypothetical protein
MCAERVQDQREEVRRSVLEQARRNIQFQSSLCRWHVTIKTPSPAHLEASNRHKHIHFFVL